MPPIDLFHVLALVIGFGVQWWIGRGGSSPSPAPPPANPLSGINLSDGLQAHELLLIISRLTELLKAQEPLPASPAPTDGALLDLLHKLVDQQRPPKP